MKSLLLAIALLAGSSAFAQVGTMKQSYLHCSTTDASNYTLILVDGAIGEPTAINLMEYKAGDWQSLAKREIISISPLAKVGFPGDTAVQYEGQDFKAVRTVKKHPTFNMQVDSVRLTIGVDSQELKLEFECSTVE